MCIKMPSYPCLKCLYYNRCENGDPRWKNCYRFRIWTTAYWIQFQNNAKQYKIRELEKELAQAKEENERRKNEHECIETIKE